MDFTEDTVRQGKRHEEDVTSHSTAKKAKGSIFSVNTSKPDLKLLKEAYGLLSSREKHDFEFELVLTIDEYHHFLRCSPAVDSCSFTPQVQPLMALGTRLEGMTSSQKINFVALGIYGMVIFSIHVKNIAPMVIVFFEQLLHTSALNPVPTVVAETLRSMGNVRVEGSGRFLSCIELFTMWAHVNDVRFVLPTWNATHYPAPPKGRHSIPLLGIHGGVTYSVELASRQFGKAQSIPYLDEALQSHFDYTSFPVITNKISEAHGAWEKCRMLLIRKEKGTRPHTQRQQLQKKYDELALDHELLKRGKQLSDQQVAGLKDKIAPLEKDLAASNEICGKQKRSLKFARRQKERLLEVKADLKSKEKENKEVTDKVTKQQELKERVVKWRNAYNNLSSDALQRELQVANNLYKIAMEDMCYQLQVKKQKNQALLEEDIGLRKNSSIIAPKRKIFKKQRSPYLLKSRAMSEENTTTNLEKPAIDERVDKLEATMQAMAMTLQAISLTLSNLTTSSVSSSIALVPTTPASSVPIPSSTIASDEQPYLAHNHIPYPLEMNNPILPTTTSLTFNMPPVMGQVPATQPTPSVEMLRPVLEDGRSREMYARKMAPYANDERVLIHYFQDSLSGLASIWFSILDKKKIHTFKDVSQAFMKQYEYNISLAPTRDSLQRVTKKGNETFKEFAQQWRSEAAKFIPPLTDSEICSLFIKSTTGTFRAWLAPCVGYTFAQLVIAGEQIEDGLKAVQVNPVQPPYPYGYDPRAKCEYHNVTGHGTEYCTTLKHKIQDLIDEGKLQLDETKSAPSITQNPLPPHGAPTMNMITLDEVDRPVLENASSWSLDELFVILIEYDLIQPIASMSSDVPPVTIDDASVCLYHSNMKGHTLQICGDFQRKITELQRMGSLKFMFALESEKFIAPVTEEYFTKEKPYILQDATKAQVINQPYVLKTSLNESLMGKTSSVVMPQHSTILNSTANDVSNMTCSGWCYVSPEVEESRRAALKSKDIRIEEIPEESPKKLMSENEVAEFLNILRKSEYSIIEQLNKTPAKIYVLELMLSSEVHLDAFLKVLKEAHVPKNIDTKKFGTVFGAILAPNYINFTDDEIPDEGNGHTKALHISVQCRMMNVPHVLIDNGLALNVIPMTVLKQLKVDESHISQCNTVVHAFDGTKRNVIGKIELPVEIGPVTFYVDFFVMDISLAFNMLFMCFGILVTVNGEEEHVIRKATTIPYLGVDPGTYESSYHSMECAAASYIHPRFKGKRVEMAKPTKVAAKIMLSCTFGLGYKPKKEDWQRMRAIKAEKRLARLQGRDPRDEPMWVPHIRVTFPQPVEILCPSLDGYVVKHMGVLYVDPEGTVFIDRLLEIEECSKQARFEEVVVEDITDEVCSDDEEDSFGFNNLFGPANMTDPKERWRRMLAERAFMEKHPNFQLIHNAKAPMDPHEPVLLETPANDESLNNDAISDFIYEIDDQTYKEENNENLDPSHELTQMLRKEKPRLQPNQETETINLGTKDDRNEIKINAHLSSEERKELIKLLFEFQDVFAWSYKDMPGLDPDITVHAIPLYFEAKPFKQKLRRMKPEVLLKVKEEVQKLLDVNFIEVAMYLEWLANIVPVMKKDGRVRVCVDYRDLNKASPKDDFPLPHIQILLDNAAKNARFSFVDGYSRISRWHMLPSEFDIVYTTQKAIKGQAIADHLAEHATEDYEPIDWDFLDEDILAVEAESDSDNWKLFFDGAVNQLGCGLGAVLVSPKGDHFPIAINLDFACTNNIAEYEACIAGMHAALDMNIQDLEIYGDSALIICQTNGEWQTKDPKLIPYHQNLETLIKKFRFISLNHMPRTKNQFADALATLASMIQISKDEVIKPLVIEISQESAHCMEIKVDDQPWFHDIKQFLQNGEYPLYASEVNKKTIRKLAASYSLSGNTLYKRSADMTLLRCVDETKAKQVMTEIYADHINAPPSLLHNMSAPWPFSMWGIDVIGAINPKASNGHQFILVAIDYFTKWVEATSYASVTKKVVTSFIKREIICRYGQPKAIITDNASNLNNDMMTALCKQFKIKHFNSSPYRPKMNGAVEAANKNIKKILAKMAVTYKDWHEMLPYALHAYRTSVCTSTGATPYSLVYGMEAVLPIELEIPSMRILSESGIDEEDLIQKRIDYLNLLDEKRLAALCHGQCYQRQMAVAYNKKVKPRVFHQGDLVLRKIMPNERDPRGKFTPNYEVPYVVKEAFSRGALLLRYPDGTDYHHPVNANVVKMYYC
ncbi:hypothetical protein SLEP1_g53580 [Rubroshorea leprosula]|uniref:Uncharacterized protein n=1 Tax=Rubroshorea leprosula TaxID=152421 RepID=A0AAV5M9X4_9ROSI|nr:hypothetical protein SLEP1_g53580 [Rubroshorea leprosula]